MSDYDDEIDDNYPKEYFEEDYDEENPKEYSSEEYSETFGKISDKEEEELNTGKLNPSDYNRTGGFASENLGVEKEGKTSKYSNPYDNYLTSIYISLRDSDESQIIKNLADDIIKKIPKNRLLLLNIDILIPVALFLAIYYKKTPTPLNFENYIKKYKSINPFDFVRYYRHVSSY